MSAIAKTVFAIMAIFMLATLSACGGGGSTVAQTPAPEPTPTPEPTPEPSMSGLSDFLYSEGFYISGHFGSTRNLAGGLILQKIRNDFAKRILRPDYSVRLANRNGVSVAATSDYRSVVAWTNTAVIGVLDDPDYPAARHAPIQR